MPPAVGAPARADRSRPRGPARLGILTAGVVLAAAVLFALAGSNLFAGGGDGSGAGAVPQATASAPAPSVAPATDAQPTAKPKPGKGKGKGKDKDKKGND